MTKTIITLPQSMNSLHQGPRYLWAVGAEAAQKSVGTLVEDDRYQVVAPQLWLDTQPDREPYIPPILPDTALPYLQLYPQRLHVPEVYGFCQNDAILLLENAPVEPSGELQTAIAQAWSQTSAVRQVYWLWQVLQLWAPLLKLNVASSLLSPDNLRVEGWRVRLRELIFDADNPTQTTASFSAPSLAHLAQCWLVWVPNAKSTIADSLKAICHTMQAGASLAEVSLALNQLLLEQSARLPLRLQVFGATEVGPQRSHNEDTCYPLTMQSRTQPHDELTPRLTIVCDGIGGHEGGEVASQLAVQSLQLQIKALLTEIAEQPDLIPPALIADQLAAIVRVVNNVISAQNDAQDREARRRMGTTLVMALQVPQRVKLAGGAIASNAHELYITNVGDSRAYWVTQQYCHQLTVDDDVVTREISLGRALRRDVLKRPDSGALTQALGTRDSQYLHPIVQRFILEEDGLLLLCSDGLSDRDRVRRILGSLRQIDSPRSDVARICCAILVRVSQRSQWPRQHLDRAYLLSYFVAPPRNS
ncbi:MAG: serine/threonine-protein phosphatase [Leptolyngbyaceae cyanobacterium CSU_1_3]|nr:serine/threonine-protein phosphatase [Leptolyngbyaceae cyanobacterium CSU_1_3]